jgi:hypothetical protein
MWCVMKKAVLLGVLVSLAVVVAAFLLIRHRVMPLPTHRTAAEPQKKAKQLAPYAGIPDADWKDEVLWKKTPEYRIVRSKLYRISLTGKAWDNLTPDEVEALILNMHSPHYQARLMAVVDAGGEYPDPVISKLMPHVLGLLTDPVSSVRICAAGSLGRLGDKSVIPDLKPLLKDPIPSVTMAAQEAISRLQSQEETVPGK